MAFLIDPKRRKKLEDTFRMVSDELPEMEPIEDIQARIAQTNPELRSKMDFLPRLNPLSDDQIGKDLPEEEIELETLQDPEESALARLKEHLTRRPQRSDYRASGGRKILSGLAAGLAAAAGVNPLQASEAARKRNSRKFDEANEDWMVEGGKLKDLAQIEERSNIARENREARIQAGKDSMLQREEDRKSREATAKASLDERNRAEIERDKDRDAQREQTKTLADLTRAAMAQNRKTAKEASDDKRVQSNIDRTVSDFDKQPTVKRFTVLQEGRNFAKSLDPKTSNPGDDIGLIYAFAKAMDPESVVRESEYATVQKYAQSWLQSMGFNAARIIEGKEFLTPQARANLKTTIESKYQAGKNAYKSLAKEYGRRIDRHTKSNDGESYLTNYTDFDDKFEEAF